MVVSAALAVVVVVEVEVEVVVITARWSGSLLLIMVGGVTEPGAEREIEKIRFSCLFDSQPICGGEKKKEKKKDTHLPHISSCRAPCSCDRGMRKCISASAG